MPSYSTHRKEESPPANLLMTHDGIVHGDSMFSDVILGDGILVKLHRRLCLGCRHA